MTDSLGDRMKSYEGAWRQTLPPRLPILVRIDGRAFHTLTKSAKKPFDHSLCAVMDYVTEVLAEETQGCILAYTQSDEISLLLQQDATLQTEPFFGGVVQKIASICAANATAYFNYRGDLFAPNTLATFDARVWCMSWDEVPNYFLWRYRDWRRNSVNMLGRSVFSHKQLNGKSVEEVLGMLEDEEVFWAELENRDKHGYFFSPQEKPRINSLNNGHVNYVFLNDAIQVVMRSLGEHPPVLPT